MPDPLGRFGLVWRHVRHLCVCIPDGSVIVMLVLSGLLLAIPAARDLHVSLAGTTLAVAMGESVANMLQPFRALPILAITGIKMRRTLGFMVVTFVVSAFVFDRSLFSFMPTLKATFPQAIAYSYS